MRKLKPPSPTLSAAYMLYRYVAKSGSYLAGSVDFIYIQRH